MGEIIKTRIINMEIKIKIKYHIEVGEEVIECETLEQAEKKMKNLRSSESECYLYRTELEGKSIKEIYLIGN
jgi:hypothetical protein